MFIRRLTALRQQRPVTVIGSAVVDVIAAADALPRRGDDIALQQQSLSAGGCALNAALVLKRLGINACHALPLGQGPWTDILRHRLAEMAITSLIETDAGDNGWCLAGSGAADNRTD